MRVGRFETITDGTLGGPWHVAEKVEPMLDANWYIVNVDTGKSKKIGRAKKNGTNFYDKAIEEAKRRNYAIQLGKLLGGMR